jgi:NADPH-dependent glutamate synthase beta subunit-like oxidoreductase/Pyruvate/2-oxoacid:ferredoxin oxidoreductase delta subunit
LSKFIVFKSVDEMPEMAVSQSSMSWNKTGSWRSSTPVRGGKIPPCNFNCPAGEDIRGYIDLLKKDRVEDAFNLLTDANPLPAVCGRVCYHPCQSQCNRHSFDTEIQVRLLEKYIGDWAIEQKKKTTPGKESSKKVAVVGAGPAGLAAAHYLRRKNHAVVLYDENALPGGILHYGIPSYRLEKDVLTAELDRVLQGVEFKSNMKLGSDLDVGGLLEYSAIFLATGAHSSKKMNIDGEHVEGVVSGLEFLKNINSGGKIDLHGKEVMVVGGGNTACDVARSAYRLGGKVGLYYRRTEQEMPAFAEEIEQLKSEPIRLEFLTAPFRIERSDDGKLKVTLRRMRLGDVDDSGRASPVPVPGSEFEVAADMIFSATGEDPDLSFFPEVEKLKEGGFDFSRVDSRLRERLFVGGDILPNPRTVAHAVGSGRLAAEKIDAFLKGEVLSVRNSATEVAGFDDVNTRYFIRVNEIKWKRDIVRDSAIADRDTAVREANRCFSCGVCNSCDNCYNFCPDLAVIKTSNGYEVNLDYCKGCGICANECPGGSLRMERRA